MKRTTALLTCSLLQVQFQVQGQSPLRPRIVHQANAGRPGVVHLAPGFATGIRMPDVITSVVLGDPSRFLAEHSESEPRLVVVKPTTEEVSESNLLVTTASGTQASFALRSGGAGSRDVDFVVEYSPATSMVVSETRQIESPDVVVALDAARIEEPAAVVQEDLEEVLAKLLQVQRRASLPELYSERPPTEDRDREGVRAGVSSVEERDRELRVSFSVVNTTSTVIELLPPQVQLAGRVSTGFLIRRSHWNASEQLPVKAYLLTPKKLPPGARADGVLIVERPDFKQSNESLFLQIAETGAIDKPALAPIPFGATTTSERKTSHGK